MIPKDHAMLRNSNQEPTNAHSGLTSLEMTTYPPPDRGIAAIRIEKASTERMMMIPPIRKAMTIGGIPATHRFSGSGAAPVNWKTRFCQPRPMVLQRIMITAVSGPISLTSPVAFLTNSFFSV